jgi:hypothetical protein
MNDIEPIQRFMTRVRAASASGSKDIRLTTNEALELVSTLAFVLAGQVAKSSTPKTVNVTMGGGTFKQD